MIMDQIKDRTRQEQNGSQLGYLYHDTKFFKLDSDPLLTYNNINMCKIHISSTLVSFEGVDKDSMLHGSKPTFLKLNGSNSPGMTDWSWCNAS